MLMEGLTHEMGLRSGKRGFEIYYSGKKALEWNNSKSVMAEMRWSKSCEVRSATG